jgi:hypothetical protein
MTFKLGSTDINGMWLGGVEIKKALLGSTAIYDKTGGGGAPLTLTANVLVSAGSSTIGFVASINTASVTITAGRPVFVAWSDSSYNEVNQSRTISGAGQTWVKVVDKIMYGESQTYDRYTVWKADPAVNGSGVITLGNPDGTDNSAYAVIEIVPEAGASISIGAPTEATQVQAATTNSVALGSADYWLAVACHSSYRSGIGQTGLPRAGWTELSDSSTNSSEAWYGGVHTQLSPQGGDTTASVTIANATGIALMCFPLTVS